MTIQVGVQQSLPGPDSLTCQQAPQSRCLHRHYLLAVCSSDCNGPVAPVSLQLVRRACYVNACACLRRATDVVQ